MSKKSELISVVYGYKSKYEAVQAQVTKVYESSDYTDEGKEKEANKIIAGLEETAKQSHDKALSIIDSALEGLSAKWRSGSTGKLSDAGYQMGLSNVLKMLGADAIHEEEDMKNIIDTYKEDYNAIATIGNLLRASSHALQFSVLIPKDNREYNKRLLNQLRGNIENTINLYMIQGSAKAWNNSNQGLTGVSMALDGMTEFINTRLGDDLELVEQMTIDHMPQDMDFNN